jgi:hypothetical protein
MEPRFRKNGTRTRLADDRGGILARAWRGDAGRRPFAAAGPRRIDFHPAAVYKSRANGHATGKAPAGSAQHKRRAREQPDDRNMDSPLLPSYAFLIVIGIVLANVATVVVVVITMGEHGGSVFAGAPPMLAGLSCLTLVLCYYKIMLPVEVSFWGSAFLAAMGLWGAWADYTHLADRKKSLGKPRSSQKSTF